MCYYDYVNMPSRSEKSEWFIFFGSWLRPINEIKIIVIKSNEGKEGIYLFYIRISNF